MPNLELTVNGRRHTLDVPADESLLTTLRTRLHLTSLKDGCQPQGQCGCCLALIDGSARTTCATPTTKCANKSITTLEGLDARTRNLLAQSFVAAGGLQCGFCIPGIALRAHHLVAENPEPTREEIARAIDGNLCRCTGYVKILDAIELYARCVRTGETPELGTTGGVGADIPRYEGLAAAWGDQHQFRFASGE